MAGRKDFMGKMAATIAITAATGVHGAKEYEMYGEAQLRANVTGVGGTCEITIQGRLSRESAWSTITIITGTGTTGAVNVSTWDFVRFNVTNADGTGEVTASGFFSKPALSSDSFTTIQVDAGTNPVADSDADTLTLTSSDSSVTITGNSTTDTIDLTGAGSPPGGSDPQVQYNNGGAFGGDSEFNYDDTNKGLLIGGGTTAQGVVGGTTFTTRLMLGADASAPNTPNLGLRTATDIALWGATLFGGRMRGTFASPAIVQDNDNLLDIFAVGWDGTDFAQAAALNFEVDGTPGNNDMPGRILFKTSADGSHTPTERMRIDSSGNVGIGTDAPAQKLHIVETVAGDDAYFTVEQSDNTNISSHAVMELKTGGSSSGDPKIVFSGPSWTWAMGVDNNENDDFRIGNSVSLGGSHQISITPSTGNFGLGNDQLAIADQKVTINGDSDTSSDYSLVCTNDSDVTTFSVRNDGRLDADDVYAAELNLTDTVWTDISIPMTTAKASGTNDPTWGQLTDDGSSSTGIFAWNFSASTEEELWFAAEFPHGWKSESDAEVHIHWAPDSTDTGNVVWGVEWYWTNIGGTIGNSTISEVTVAADGTINKHQYDDIVSLTGTGKTLSSHIMGRVFRKAADGADTFTGGAFLLSLGVHFEMDSLGSRDELVK